MKRRKRRGSDSVKEKTEGEGQADERGKNADTPARGCWTAFTYLFTLGMYVSWGVAVFSLFLLGFGDDAESAYELGYTAFSCAIMFTGLHLLFRRGIPEALYMILWEP